VQGGMEPELAGKLAIAAKPMLKLEAQRLRKQAARAAVAQAARA
jgi:hypothetical protein